MVSLLIVAFLICFKYNYNCTIWTLGGHVMSENEKDLELQANENEEVVSDQSENTDDTPTMSEAMSEVNEINVGDLVTGEVLTIDDEGNTIVGLSGGQEGFVPPREISASPVDDVNEVVSVGDEIEVVVIRRVQDKEQGSYQLSKRRVDAQKVWDDLQVIFEKGETIEAPVTRVVKGGLVVDAGVRGFIPASLVDVNYIDDFSPYEGKTLELLITEIEPSENRLILSHKAVEEAELEEEKAETLANLNEGDTVTGKVARIVNFGAFIDLGGVDGLIHISEIAHEHVNDAHDYLTVGEDIEVEVLSVDPEDERISLSRKNIVPGPWENIGERVQAGDVVDGTVKRLVDFGAFVEVFPGVEGLLHISQISHRHIATPFEVLEPGEEIQVQVLDVDEERERLSLSLKALEEEPEQTEETQSSKPKNNKSNKSRQNNKSQSSNNNDNDVDTTFTFGELLGDQLSDFQFDDDSEN